MRQQDNLKRTALQNMTDLDTPFRATKTQQIFKNTANVTLRGNTFDARHLDQFLQSGYGEKSIMPGDTYRNNVPMGVQANTERRSAGKAFISSLSPNYLL